MIEISKTLEKGKVMVGFTYYDYKILDTINSPVVEGIVSSEVYNEVCKKIFIKNQKAIDNKRTSKERRKLLIKINNDILRVLKERSC